MKSVTSAKGILKKIGISTILLTFVVASFPLISLAQLAPSLTLSVVNNTDNTTASNGGSISVNSTDSYTYTWSTSNIVPGSCQLTSPLNSGITDSGNDTISSGNPFFPTSSSPTTTITVVCTGSDSSTLTESVAINLSVPPPVVSSVDIKANGSDGPVTLASTDTSYTYTWTSSDIVTGSCQLTSPVNSGVTDSGTDTVQNTDGFFFPTSSSPVIITIVCTGTGGASVTDSVTINIAGGGGTVPTATLVANPTSVAPNATSTLTWTSSNTISCSAPWTTATSTSGSQIVTVATTTVYSITCTDGTQNAIAQATVTVVPGGFCPVPTISSSLTASGTVNQPFTYTLTATGTTTSVFTVATSSLPVGVTFDPTTNTISGTPTAAGTFTVALTSTDSCGTDAQNLVITIATAPGGG